MTYIDIHVIQTVPPANINRDDTGSPKSARFGGTRRARVSSQSWKRASRAALQEVVPYAALSVRTKRLTGAVADLLADLGIDREAALDAASAAVAAVGISAKKNENTDYLLFVGRTQISEFAKLVSSRVAAYQAAGEKQRKDVYTDLRDELKAALVGTPSVDLALFGRMLADTADLNVDASVQVAHAISTHPVELEFDYFTAVDDLNAASETGAGMIGTVEFNSSTLYRYANLNLEALRDNLDGSFPVADAAAAFIQGFVTSMPTGHQNTFAHRTLPDLVLICARGGQPINLVSAFEDAVTQKPFAATSAERLLAHCSAVEHAFGAKSTRTWLTSVVPRDGSAPFPEIVEAVRAFVRGALE